MWRAEFKTSWKDKKSNPLEKQIPDIAKGFSRAFELSKTRSQEAEKLQKIRAIEEAERAKQARVAAIEKQKRNELLSLVAIHQTSTNILWLVAAIEAKGPPSEALSNWLKWAKGVANDMDPTHNATGILDRFNLVADESSWIGDPLLL